MKLIRNRFILGCAIATLAGVGTTAKLLAHHSQSQFEPELSIAIEGTLTKASWSNALSTSSLIGFIRDGFKTA